MYDKGAADYQADYPEVEREGDYGAQSENGALIKITRKTYQPGSSY